MFILTIGNRGLLLEFWNTTFKNHDDLPDVMNFSTAASDYSSGVWDEARFEGSGVPFAVLPSRYTSRVRGFFVPPADSDYQFLIRADDQAILYFSLTGNPADKVSSFTTLCIRRFLTKGFKGAPNNC